MEWVRAGTGKSLVIKHILRALPAATTFLTASTGLAASALGGTTLNAFAGIGRAEGGLQVHLSTPYIKTVPRVSCLHTPDANSPIMKHTHVQVVHFFEACEDWFIGCIV